MKYNEALQAISTKAALKALKIEGREEGAYIHFPCPKCQEEAVIRFFGEKKNLWLCTKCKLSGHIISLAMNIQELDYERAKWFLLEQTGNLYKEAEELTLNYTLEWCDFMEQAEFNKKTCELLGVGKPKGKTILAGYLAFTVLNAEDKKIAYVGLRLSDGKKYFPKNFNPELYLYCYSKIDFEEEVILTPDMLECIDFWSNGKQSISTFWLDYLTLRHLALLQKVKYLTLTSFGDKIRELGATLSCCHEGFHRFI